MADFHSLKRRKKKNDSDWSRQIFHGRKFKTLKIFNFLQCLFFENFLSVHENISASGKCPLEHNVSSIFTKALLFVLKTIPTFQTNGYLRWGGLLLNTAFTKAYSNSRLLSYCFPMNMFVIYCSR